MYNIVEVADDLKRVNAGRDTPYPMTKNDYIKIVVQAIKKFYSDINHPEQYDRTLFITDEDDILYYDHDFDIQQEEYIFIVCRKSFLEIVYSEFSGSGAISYTTNALSVTGAKEGYKSVQQELDDLERERIRVFHKMMARDEG